MIFALTTKCTVGLIEGVLEMNNVEKLLKSYDGYCFESSMYETPEFRNFCTRLKKAMRKDVRENYPNLELSAWSKGHFEVSGFITRKSDGAIFYFRIGDVRDDKVATGFHLYRSAGHLKDYMGGINRYCLGGELLKRMATEYDDFAEERLK